MVVGVVNFDILINGAFNLKEKRSYVKSLVGKIRNKFSVSVAEVDHQDLWQRTQIGVAVVGANSAIVNSVIDKVTEFVYSNGDFEVIERKIEILRY
ncbi:MAG: DUF503 family protein [Deltaproteobacteria bacterium]|nr:DUF503 family protein [Deltaproteobacteria bacterium]